jgi:hypothetical protein
MANFGEGIMGGESALICRADRQAADAGDLTPGRSSKGPRRPAVDAIPPITPAFGGGRLLRSLAQLFEKRGDSAKRPDHLMTTTVGGGDGQAGSRWRMRDEGPPFIRAGRNHSRVYYLESDIAAWIQRRKRASTSEADRGQG